VTNPSQGSKTNGSQTPLLRTLFPPRALIVEDNQACAILARIILEREGYVVTVARTARQGLAALRVGDFDLLLCDLVLPDGHGAEIIAHVRQRGEPLHAIAVTGYVSIESHVAALADGFDAFLAKPFRIRMLTDLVNAAPPNPEPRPQATFR
jgi:CheY-like chemotaxis protein